MYDWLWKLLSDQRGEVGGTEDATDTGDMDAEAGAEGDQQDSPTEGQEESFVDPESLSEDLKNTAEYKGMVRAFSRKMNRFKEAEDKIAILDRIANDADYRRQFVTRAAQQMGMQITESSNGQQQQQAPQNPALDQLETALPGLGNALKDLIRSEIAPLKAQAEQSMTETQRRVAQQEWDRAAMELTERDPAWEDSSDDIGDLYEFLKSGQMFHPVWGNKLEILHKLARGEDYAAAEAVSRMRSAAQNKTHTGRHGGGQINITDIHKQITEAPTAQSKWDIAAQYALEEMKRTGGRA